MNPQSHMPGTNPRARRWFFQQCGVGLGAIALGTLFRESGWAAPAAPTSPLAPKQPHFPAKAKRVIFLFQAGAPSHLELFDNKPELAKWNGKVPPAELVKDYRAAFINPSSTLPGPKFKFAKHGQSGTELSELLPHLPEIVDDIAIVKSMHTDAFNHAPGQILMSTGSQQFGRPSMGAWATYGLGSESQDLPAFVVFSTGQKGPSGGASNWGAGFLPMWCRWYLCNPSAARRYGRLARHRSKHFASFLPTLVYTAFLSSFSSLLNDSQSFDSLVFRGLTWSIV